MRLYNTWYDESYANKAEAYNAIFVENVLATFVKTMWNENNTPDNERPDMPDVSPQMTIKDINDWLFVAYGDGAYLHIGTKADFR